MRYEDKKMRPYVRVRDGDSEAIVRERCKELAYQQLESLLGQPLPVGSPAPVWLDANAPKTALNRIRMMLNALDNILREHYGRSRRLKQLQKLDQLHRLEWSPDRRTASTPVLLAIGALIHSHMKWSELNLHDIRSAVATEELLRKSRKPEPYPQWIIDKIPPLIALKNLYRTCSKKGLEEEELPEVGVYQKGKKLVFDKTNLAYAIANILCSAYSNSDASVAAEALFLIAISYEGRHGKPFNLENFEAFTDKVKEAIDSSSSDQDRGTLVNFEFRRHILLHREGNEARQAKDLLERMLNELLKDKQNKLPPTVWISFDRFWAIRHSDSLREWLKKASSEKLSELFPPCQVSTSKSFIEVLEWSDFYALKLEADDAFRVAFNCSPDQPTCKQVPSDIWQRISTAISLFQKRRDLTFGQSTVTWAYLMRVLYVLKHIYPDEFFKLTVLRPDSPKELGNSNIIMLPKKLPQLEYLKKLVKQFDKIKEFIKSLQKERKEIKNLLKLAQSEQERTRLKEELKQKDKEIEQAVEDNLKPAINWNDPQLLTSRCLATLLLNQRMAFGDRQQILKVDQGFEELRDKWLEIRQWVAQMNQHKALERYLQVYLNPKVQLEKETPLKAPAKGPTRIVGFDIGGTDIKAAIYEYDPETETLGERIYEKVKLGTQPKQKKPSAKLSFVEQLDNKLIDKWGGNQYPDASSFVERLDRVLTHEWGKDWQKDLMAIGITWPGAVSGEPGHEYITSYSKSLGYFQPFKKPFTATADEIHQLEFREAFEQYFHKPVTLINDGVAHVLYHQWQFNPEILSVGEALETIVGLFAGTGSAEAVLSGDTGKPLNVLAELGKQIDNIGCPFTINSYPAGTNRNIFNKDTLPAIAKEFFKEKGINTLSKVPGLVIGWILEQNNSRALEMVISKIQSELDSGTFLTELDFDTFVKNLSKKLVCQEGVDKFALNLAMENLAEFRKKESLKPTELLEKLQDCLRNSQAELAQIKNLLEQEKPWKDVELPLPESIESWLEDLAHILGGEAERRNFALLSAQKAGQRLADLIAQVRELFGSRNVFTGGGPMSGTTGKYIRHYARQELREGYGFDVVGDESYVIQQTYNAASMTHHLTRLIRFPEPHKGIEPPGPSGCRGVAMTALTRFTKQSTNPASSPSFSAFSVLELGSRVSGCVYFPGRSHLLDLDGKIYPAGYVRSRSRACQSHKVRTGRKKVYDPLPWRDYEDKALTSINNLTEMIKNTTPHIRNHVIISARNTINEWRYQVRINGEWYRRLGDSDIPLNWPVFAISDKSACLLPFSEAKNQEANLVTGIPLVIEGQQMSRTFLVANCSDIAHVYEVDPKGRRGPSATAWQMLSECWQRGKDEDVPDYVLDQRMDRIAKRYGIQLSRNLLHSVIAERQNGELLALAMTGGLTDIARELATNYQVRHAVLLDNGGSVGWHTILNGDDKATLLVAGPNYRPRGLVFIDLWVNDFVHPHEHLVLSLSRGGE